MRLNPKKTAFGRHESFALRYSWLTKGYRTNKRTPLEESLDSPLSLLRLISHSPDGRRFFSKSESREQLPLSILGYAIADLFITKDVKTLPIEELMYSKYGDIAPGIVFRLTENDLISKLEKLVHYLPGAFEIRETAGIHQLYRLEDIKWILLSR